MGFFGIDQNRNETTNVSTRTIQGTTSGILNQGNDSANQLNSYDIRREFSPTIVTGDNSQAESSRVMPTLGGLNWQAWLIIGLAVVAIFFFHRKN